MPLKAIDFSKTIIYKIQKDDDFYVGSTTDFASRKSHHRHSCNNEKSHHYNYKLYNTIRDNGGWDTWEMIPLEEYVDCKSQIQARIREEEWREKLQAKLNSHRAHLSEEVRVERDKQYQTQYYKEHVDEIRVKRAQYYQKHADEIKAEMAVKYECECGSVCRIGDKAKHEKTKKHQAYLKK
jgi:hypothetical protein